MLIAQNDDPELLEWLAKADQDGGGFVRSVARAALVADPENYPLIRPLVLALRQKYPVYGKTVPASATTPASEWEQQVLDYARKHGEPLSNYEALLNREWTEYDSAGYPHKRKERQVMPNDTTTRLSDVNGADRAADESGAAGGLPGNRRSD
jgi:hypothetical protein